MLQLKDRYRCSWPSSSCMLADCTEDDWEECAAFATTYNSIGWWYPGKPCLRRSMEETVETKIDQQTGARSLLFFISLHAGVSQCNSTLASGTTYRDGYLVRHPPSLGKDGRKHQYINFIGFHKSSWHWPLVHCHFYCHTERTAAASSSSWDRRCGLRKIHKTPAEGTA